MEYCTVDILTCFDSNVQYINVKTEPKTKISHVVKMTLNNTDLNSIDLFSIADVVTVGKLTFYWRISC